MQNESELQIVSELPESLDFSLDSFLDWEDFINFSINKRQELIKNEVLEIINDKTRLRFLRYIQGHFDYLVNLDKSLYPETYDICAKSFNLMLRQFIENDLTKGFLMSSKKRSEMHFLKEEIIMSFSEFIDEDILHLFSSGLENN